MNRTTLSLLGIACTALSGTTGAAIADAPPPPWGAGTPLIRLDTKATKIKMMDEDIRVTITPKALHVSERFILQNPGPPAFTNMGMDISIGRFWNNDVKALSVKLNGKPLQTGRRHNDEMNLEVRDDDWRIKIGARSNAVIDVSYTVPSNTKLPDGSELVTIPGTSWKTAAEEKLLTHALADATYRFNLGNRWADKTHHRKIIMTFANGLSRDNVVRTEPKPSAQTSQSLTWEFKGEPPVERISIKYMPSFTLTQLISAHKSLLPKHPNNPNLIREIGELYAAQGRHDLELKTYADYLLPEAKESTQSSRYAVEGMLDAWSRETESTKNQLMAGKLAKLYRPLMLQSLAGTPKTESRYLQWTAWLNKYASDSTATSAR